MQNLDDVAVMALATQTGDDQGQFRCSQIARLTFRLAHYQTGLCWLYSFSLRLLLLWKVTQTRKWHHLQLFAGHGEETPLTHW